MKKIAAMRLAEINAFKNTDFSDCPELTYEQLAQMKPSHYRKYNSSTNIEEIKIKVYDLY